MLSKKDHLTEKELASFPQLVMEPWRVEEMVEEESAFQRYRLFRRINWVRQGIALLMLLYFLFLKKLDPVVMTVLVSYLILIFSLVARIGREKELIKFYAFFIGLLDIFILGYFFLIFGSKLEFAFLFLSVLLSSVFLPFFPLLITLCFSIVVVGSVWILISTDSYKLYGSFSDKISYSYQVLVKNMDWNEVGSLAVFLLFITIIINRMANWSFRNEVRAQFRYKQLTQVLTFNRSIIEHLKSGVLVLTRNGKVLSINQRAIELLNLRSGRPVTELQNLSEDLASRFSRWQLAQIESTVPYKHNRDSEDVSVSFSSFGKEDGVIMMTLESTNESFRQAQEAKLTSLGRLTAGIAHEIRNPLSAINSAAELISESANSPQESRLSGMILTNVKRTNQIISDVLSLFKDSSSSRKLLSIRKVLEQFREQFFLANNSEEYELLLETNTERELFVLFDEGQLEQILWNLCQNALRYGRRDDKPLIVVIRYTLSPSKKNLYIEVIDNGDGISEDKQDKIFEPFFTGHRKGSGLGLYLVRELCSSNNANILYFYEKGACFRMIVQVFYAQKVEVKPGK